MELNSFLFPAPQSSYTIHGAIGDLLYIPRDFSLDTPKVEIRLEVASQPTTIRQYELGSKSERVDAQENQNVKNETNRNKSHSFLEEQKKREPLVDSTNLDHSKGGKELNQSMLNEESKGLNGKSLSFHYSSEQKEFKTQTDVVNQSKSTIPCLYLPYAQGSSKFMIYFHGNAEDVGLASELLDYIRSLLRVHVIAMEYPGYGIYDGSPDAYQILLDSESVYNYLTKAMRIPESSIILFGRSIGTGPATYLASKNNPCSLLLMSPFKSIRDIVKEQAGRVLQYLISDRFRNIDFIENVRCPTFFVHGQKDTLISFRHSQELHYKCGGPSALIMPKDMDHNEFDFIDDLIQPYHQFLKQCGISVEPDDTKFMFENNNKGGLFKFPEDLYMPPADFPKQNSNSTLWNWILRKFM